MRPSTSFRPLPEPLRAARAHALAGLQAGIWPAAELARGAGPTVASGHAALDAELPGGGWPRGALVELLQPVPDAPVWPLLLPAVAARQQASGGAVVLVNPPHEPFVPLLAAAGVAPRQLLWLRADTPAAQSWGAEQALRCADVAAVLAWLPHARTAELRRLQQAAAQTGALLFVLRPEGRAADAASPARLRLRVAGAVRAPERPRLRLVGEDGPSAQPPDWPALRVDLLKRRGPPLAEPLWLPVCSAAVAALAHPRRGWAAPLPPSVLRWPPPEERHALAGLAVAAG